MNSQCCHIVSNTTTPDPSMGFVPLQDPQSAALHKTNLAAKSRHYVANGASQAKLHNQDRSLDI
jgi:hypothetical protein